jgi:hypothetical protein
MIEAGAAVAVAVEAPPLEAEAEATPQQLRHVVLAALESAGQQVLAHNLEQGQWAVRGAEVSVTVGMSQVLIDVALGAEPKRLVNEALGKASGRPMKFKLVSGGTQFIPQAAAPRPANGASARSRAMADPIVQRMQEKFAAEIRTVIDLKDRS